MKRGPERLILDVGKPLAELEKVIEASYAASGITDQRFDGIVAEALDSYVHDIMHCISKKEDARDNLNYYIKHCAFNCDDIDLNYVNAHAVHLQNLGESLLGQLSQFGVYDQPNPVGSIPYYYAERKDRDALLFRHE